MPTLEFTRADIQRLQHERFQHPHPRVQRKMEAVYLTRQGLSRATVCRLTQLSRGMLATYVRQSRTGGVARLQAVNFYRPQSAFLAYQATSEAHFAAPPPATINQARTTLTQLTGIPRAPTQVRLFLQRGGWRCRKVGSRPAAPVVPAQFLADGLQPRLDEAVAGQRQVDEGRTTLADKLKADYESATREEQSLHAALEKAQSEAVQQNQSTVQFGLLQQEAQMAKAMYTEFLQKTNQASIQLNEQHKDLQVIEAASLPVAPVGPNRLRLILIGFFISLGFGIAIALTIEYSDDTIKSSEDITRYTGLPALAIIPVARLSRLRLRGSAGKAAALLKEKLEPGMQHPLMSQTRGLADSSASMLTEAYRGLRTSLLLSAAGTPPKTLLFTSSEPGEGKTTTTTNTAISLAQLGLSVVIIDADLRRPSIHKVFGLDPAHGISSYLSQNMRRASLLQDSPIPYVSVLPCGAIPPNPTELISSEKMRLMVQLLRQHFDHVLIDSPPLTNVADSLVLSTLADGVVLVVQ